jgi:hypothetical protein
MIDELIITTPRKPSRKLTDAERDQRDALIVADAPTHTKRELEAKYGISFTGIDYILKKFGVESKSGYYCRKGEKKKWVTRTVRDPNATELTCSRCNVTKPVPDFYEERLVCRACTLVSANKWAANNPEASRKAKDKYADANREEIKEKNREYYWANLESEHARSRKYYRNNREACMATTVACHNRRMKTDAQYRLRVRTRQRIWRLLNGVGQKKGSRTEVLIGMKHADFVKYIESLWLPGMSWNNYAWDGWHIDHIIPCSSFDLTDPEQQAKCFHWSNMRPLWCMDNWRKGSKIIVD